jgi:hypothetical protein
MTREEVLVFKQWDSDPTKTGRICFHSAIVDPMARPDAPPRESIEVRAIAVFPDSEANMCPSVTYPEPMSPAKIVDKIEAVIANILFLPLLARMYFRLVFRTSRDHRKGIERIVDALLLDKGNKLGIEQGSTREARSEAKDLMMIDEKFYMKVMASKTKLDNVVLNRRRRTPWIWWLFPSNW